MIKFHRQCRVCGIALPAPFLDLGRQPLANAFRCADETAPEFTAPLAITRCVRCGLSQLTTVVDPSVLYSGYHFSSGVSPQWKDHCALLARTATIQLGKGTAIDIASNDGTMLRALKQKGWVVQGVEPSNVDAPGIDTVREFWSPAVACDLYEQYGPVSLIVAQNVLGHVDDVWGFLEAAKGILAPAGRLVIEVPHMGSLIDSVAFDTIYHEHLSYWHLRPLLTLAHQIGLDVVEVERFPMLHGGSRRYWLAHRNAVVVQPSVAREIAWEQEQGLDGPDATLVFGNRVARIITETKAILTARTGSRLMAFGASAKGTVMLNTVHKFLPKDSGWPCVVYDETLAKQGKRVPGVGVPIEPLPESLSHVDCLWLLSWNWRPTLEAKAVARGFSGEFLVTNPRPRVYSPGTFLDEQKSIGVGKIF